MDSPRGVPRDVKDRDPADMSGRTPVDVVVDYLTSVHDWEVRSSELVDAQADDAGVIAVLDQIKAEKAAILERLGTLRAVATNTTAAFGTPPSRDPAKTRVIGVEARGPHRSLVVTEESFAPETWAKHRYEYALERVAGEWRLNSRTSIDDEGKRIRGLL